MPALASALASLKHLGLTMLLFGAHVHRVHASCSSDGSTQSEIQPCTLRLYHLGRPARIHLGEPFLRWITHPLHLNLNWFPRFLTCLSQHFKNYPSSPIMTPPRSINPVSLLAGAVCGYTRQSVDSECRRQSPSSVLLCPSHSLHPDYATPTLPGHTGPLLHTTP